MRLHSGARWKVILTMGSLIGGGSAAGLLWNFSQPYLTWGQCLVVLLALTGALAVCVLAYMGLRRIPGFQCCRKKRNADRIPEEILAQRRFSAAVSILVLLFCAGVFLALSLGAGRQAEASMAEIHRISYERGKVISVEEDAYERDPEVDNVPIGHQSVRVQILSGPHRGEEYVLKNYLSYFYGSLLAPGDRVMLSRSDMEGREDLVMLQDFDRTIPLLAVVGFFLLITVLVGGKVGAKSLLGLGITILCIFEILIPNLFAGAPTMPAVLLICGMVTVVTFVILDGVNRKTLCAIFGTILGVCFAAVFGKLACGLLRVSGLRLFEADSAIETLLQIKEHHTAMGMPSIHLQDLLVGGVMIAALGAVNDVAMSIASAMNELITVHPGLSRKALLRSGMRIGRDMVGTMTNTLILALVGSSFVTILYLYALQPTFSQFMTTSYFSVEMVQVLASSIGVIVGVPMSVILGTILFGGIKNEKAGKNKEKINKGQ